MLLPLVLYGTAVAAATLPQFADSIPTLWSNSTVQTRSVTFDLRAVELDIEKRQCAGMRICDNRACMPNGKECCRGGSHCDAGETCVENGCCPGGWSLCRANDGSGREACYPRTSGAMCCSDGGYCQKDHYCLAGGRCCPLGRVCRGDNTGGGGDGQWELGQNSGSESEEKEQTTERTSTTEWRETIESGTPAAGAGAGVGGATTEASTEEWVASASTRSSSSWGPWNYSTSAAASIKGVPTTSRLVAAVPTTSAPRSSTSAFFPAASVSATIPAKNAPGPLIPGVLAVAICVGLIWV